MSDSNRTGRTDPALARPVATPTALSLIAGFRVVARRRHVARWGLAALAASALAIALGGAQSDARRTRAAWGTSTEVWVATSPIAAGQQIDDTHIVQRRLPVAALPVDAAVDDPTGSRVTADVATGEVIRAGRLARFSAGAMAARLPADTRGVTIRVAEAASLQEGDIADLVAMIGGRPVAVSTLVIDVGNGWATFAVRADRVSEVVEEISLGGVMPVLVP